MNIKDSYRAVTAMYMKTLAPTVKKWAFPFTALLTHLIQEVKYWLDVSL